MDGMPLALSIADWCFLACLSNRGIGGIDRVGVSEWIEEGCCRVVSRWRRGLMSVQGRAELNSTARLHRNLHQVLGTSNVQVDFKTSQTEPLIRSLDQLPFNHGAVAIYLLYVSALALTVDSALLVVSPGSNAGLPLHVEFRGQDLSASASSWGLDLHKWCNYLWGI
jgi:hypothetical protein